MEYEMNWIEVVGSQAMSHYGYDPASYTLGIKTLGGTPYFYIDVPPEVHAKFVQEKSKGRFWIAHIKTKYECRHGDLSATQKSPESKSLVPGVDGIIRKAAEKK